MGSVKINLFKSKKYKDGRHPIMIRIIQERDIKYINTDVSAFEEEWDSKSNQINELYKKKFKLNKITFDTINLNISNLYNKVRGIISNLDNARRPYSLNDILKHLEKVTKPLAFCVYTQKLIDDLIVSGKIGNALNYQTVKNNVLLFTKNKDIVIEKINYRWLCDFEKFHLSKPSRSIKGNPVNGLNVYMRAIRAIYNKAVKEGLVADGINPFGKNGYEIQKAPIVKRAITKEKIDAIRSLDFPENTVFWQTKNYFLFSFYCRGITWVDIAHLKRANILDGRIEYVRIKTMRKNAKTFSIKITPQIQEILDYYLINNIRNDFIFPIIKRSDLIGQRKDIKNELKKFNKYIKRIGKMCGIEKNMTSYVARHSWGTIAKKEMHISTSLISEGYGHKDELTTKAYLEDFDYEDIDIANSLITD